MYIQKGGEAVKYLADKTSTTRYVLSLVRFAVCQPTDLALAERINVARQFITMGESKDRNSEERLPYMVNPKPDKTGF